MAQDLNYIVVEATTTKELEKKVNDRMAFGYTTNTPIVVTQNNQGSTFYQTMTKAK